MSDRSESPLILTVPGLDGSGPRHWQSQWEKWDEHTVRVDLGEWQQPHRNSWVNRLNLAIERAARPVVLAAHSLGCLAVAWWVAYERPVWGSKVLGALLVAPPDVDAAVFEPRLLPFAPTPLTTLPFPSILAASRDDPYASLDRSRRLAAFWGSRFADLGALGHVNAESGIGAWPGGRRLIDRLIGTAHQDYGPKPMGSPMIEYALTN
ncbi:MAG: RBBP9/YdeN family alpha/beta hydrolase [Novosphingobium sp.]